MLNSLLTRIFGSRNERLLRQFQKNVARINAYEPELEKLDDAALKAKTDEFRARVADGASLDELLPDVLEGRIDPGRVFDRTVGLDGNPQSGAGQACEVVRDTCARVPDGGLCDAWKKRRDETEVAYRFARRENAEKNRAEYERVARILSESDCGK